MHSDCGADHLRAIIWIIAAILIGPKQTAPLTKSAHGTLIIVSATKSSIVIAADSGLVQNGKIISTKQQKIIPAGHDSACFLVGLVYGAFAGRTERENLPATVRAWVAKHPHAGVRQTHQGLTDAIATELADVRVPGLQALSTVSVGCIGFDGGTPVIVNSDIYMQTDSGPHVIKTDHVLLPGLVIPVGWASTAAEMLRGDGAALESFKSEPIVRKYREASRNGTLASLTERDLLSVSSACLKATETRAAQNFDPDASEVSAPNHFAVIDKQKGFRWVQVR